jgi:hypothetical protein
MSEPLTTSPLSAALAAAQAELSDPIRAKTMAVPGRPSRAYAGLDDLLQAVRPVLARHGIAVSQVIRPFGEGSWALETQLRHASGEVLTSHYPLDWKGGPQDQGSRLTYARRYSLEAICAVAATEDDDAETPQRTQAKPPKPKPPPPSSPTSGGMSPESPRTRTGAGTASEGGQESQGAKTPARWTESEQRSFFGDLSRIWPEGPDHYDHLAAWCEAHGHPRPSVMTPARRGKLLAALESREKQTEILEWQPEATEQPQADA